MVSDEVPLLLPITLLKSLGAVINLSEGTMFMTQFQRVVPLHSLPTGHIAKSILEFDVEGWSLPEEAQRQGVSPGRFSITSGPSSCLAAAMSTKTTAISSPFNQLRVYGSFETLGEDEAGGGGRGPDISGGANGGWSSGRETLGPIDGAGARCDQGPRVAARAGSRSGRSLAGKWITLWICASTAMVPCRRPEEGVAERGGDSSGGAVRPRAQKVRGDRMRNNIIKIQLEDLEVPVCERRVEDEFWVQADGGYELRRGILPSSGAECVVRLREVYGECDLEEDAVFGVLSRGSRKRLRREMQKLKVSEIFSEPRVSAEAVRGGLQAGSAVDIKTGFDLMREGDR